MDGLCHRCGMVSHSIEGEYCQRCGNRLCTRPAQGKISAPSTEASVAPAEAGQSGHTVPTVPTVPKSHVSNNQQKFSRINVTRHGPEIRSTPRYRVDGQHRNTLQKRTVQNYPTGVLWLGDHSDEQLSTASRQNVPSSAAVEIVVKDPVKQLERQPSSRRRDSRSRFPSRNRSHHTGVHDATGDRDYVPVRPSALYPQSYVLRFHDPWCLWCHFAGHFGYPECRSMAKPPARVVKHINSLWDDYYLAPRIQDLRSPTTLIHLKDIAHQLVSHCNKFELWIKERDTFITVVVQDLKSDPDPAGLACCRDWKWSMAAANVATNDYLLAMQGFAKELSQSHRLIRQFLLRLADREQASLRLTKYDRRRLGSDPERLTQLLHGLRSESTKIQLDQTDYRTTVDQYNATRRRYVRSWDDVAKSQTEATRQILRPNLCLRLSKKIEVAFASLQAANPAPGRDRLAYIATDEGTLPNIAEVRRRWQVTVNSGA